jgi:hypothetical protein
MVFALLRVDIARPFAVFIDRVEDGDVSVVKILMIGVGPVVRIRHYLLNGAYPATNERRIQ